MRFIRLGRVWRISINGLLPFGRLFLSLLNFAAVSCFRSTLIRKNAFNNREKRNEMGILWFILIIALWFVLQAFVLPRLGIST